MMGKPNELDIGDILRSLSNGDGPLQVMFAGPDGRPVPMDWRIALLQVLQSIDRRSYEIRNTLEAIRGGDTSANSETQTERSGDGTS